MNRTEVEMVLRSAEAYDWQVQGFGMLRTYFGDEVRLQIWDQRIAVWGNNDIHDHPWNFKSTIMAGVLYNQRYVYAHAKMGGKPYSRLKIRPGMEGREWGDEVERRWIKPQPVEVYTMGEEYEQQCSELHISRYHQGTVTVIDRERVRDEDYAYVYWRDGTPPHLLYQVRPATAREVMIVVSNALTTWF